MTHPIIYQSEDNLPASEFTDLLTRSTLAQRRPVDDRQRIEKMLAHANLIITARSENTLIGVARSLTDFAFCTYLSDLAVDQAFQRRGIGKELIRKTKLAAPDARIILLAAPAAIDYYPAIGMDHHAHCYFLDDVARLR